jgi:hypothetical protein
MSTDLTPATPDARRSALTAAITASFAEGDRLESQTDFSAVIVKGRRPNHILHLILTVLTLGVWAIVWLMVGMFGGEKRQILMVNEDGNAIRQSPGQAAYAQRASEGTV